jgi:hypothetical protein
LINTTVAIIGIVIAGGLIIATFIVQTVRTARSAVGRVLALFREVKHNENLARKFGYRGRVVPFKTEAWLRQKRDVEFLPGDLLTLMTATYEELFRLNETIAGSVEHMQESHLNTVNTAPVQEQLGRIKRELDLWITRNINNPNYAPKRPRFLWW